MDADDLIYTHVHQVANEISPEFEVDEEGNCFQIMSHVGYSFLYHMHKKKFPFTYDGYLKNEDIIGTLEAYNIDIEKFWYAILFIYDITERKCVKSYTLGDTAKNQAQKLKDYLSGIDGFTITALGKKKLVINDLLVVEELYSFLDKLLAERSEELDIQKFKFTNISRELYSSSVQMWFAANRYIKLFECLKLPNKRAKNSAESYKTVSYNKLLLISRLMYFTKMTRNDSFLYEDNSLKGILKQYKDFKLNVF